MLILDKMKEKHTFENRYLEVDKTLGLGAANCIIFHSVLATSRSTKPGAQLIAL
jgi:hypothetical protein